MNREVAIKVLPEKVASDPEALARFGTLARVALGGGVPREILEHALTLLADRPGDPRPLPLGNVRPRAVNQEAAHWSLDGRWLLFSGFEQGYRLRRVLSELNVLEGLR